MSAAIVMTGKASFEQDVIQSQLPVLVDYWAEWCAPCKAIGPLLDELAVEYQGKLRIAKVNMDEDVEIDMGGSSDVQVSVTPEEIRVDSAQATLLPPLPGVSLRSVKVDEVRRVEVSNARAAAIEFELRLSLPEGARVVRADHPLGAKNGRPIFRFKVPANQTVTVRFQTQAIGDGILRTP